MRTEFALFQMIFPKIPPTEAEKYSYFQKVWEQEKTQSFKDFLRWYNNKDVLPTLEAMQKAVEFFYNKSFYKYKLGDTLTNLANIVCTVQLVQIFINSQKAIRTCFRTFGKLWLADRLVFTRQTTADKTNIRKSPNVCELIVGLAASQLYT